MRTEAQVSGSVTSLPTMRPRVGVNRLCWGSASTPPPALFFVSRLLFQWTYCVRSMYLCMPACLSQPHGACRQGLVDKIDGGADAAVSEGRRGEPLFAPSTPHPSAETETCCHRVIGEDRNTLRTGGNTEAQLRAIQRRTTRNVALLAAEDTSCCGSCLAVHSAAERRHRSRASWRSIGRRASNAPACRASTQQATSNKQRAVHLCCGLC